MGDLFERTVAVAAMLEMCAYVMDEGEASDVPTVLRALADVLREGTEHEQLHDQTETV